MGLLRWLRGGDESSATTAAVSAGLAEIDGLFRPSKHKQTEHVQETRRRRIDVANGAGVDLDRGLAVIRRPTTAVSRPGGDDPATDQAAHLAPAPTQH